MTDQIRDRIQRAHKLFEQIRHEMCGIPGESYHHALKGSSILECVLEDLGSEDDSTEHRLLAAALRDAYVDREDEASADDELRHDLDKEIRGES